MASFKRLTDSSGIVYYQVQASGGRGRRVKRNWRPEPGWSARTIQRELHKFAAQLENDLASGPGGGKAKNTAPICGRSLHAHQRGYFLQKCPLQLLAVP